MVYLSSTSSVPSEQQLIDVFEFISDYFLIFDRDLHIIWTNKAFEKLTGMRKEEWFGRTLSEIFPHTKTPHYSNFQKVIQTKKQLIYTYHTDNNRWIETRVYPTREGGVSVLGHDVTAEIKAQEKSDQQQRINNTIIDSIPDLISIFDPNYRLIYASKIVLKLWGNKTMDEVRGKTHAEIGIDEQVIAEIKPNFYKAVSTKKPVHGTYSIHRPGRGMRDYDYVYSPVLDRRGNVSEVVGITHDISYIKKSEQTRLRQIETERRMKLLIEQQNALLKVNEAKDEFISLASHQLRTPATAVKQYAGMLLNGMAGALTPEQLHMLQIAYDSNERELMVINDLLKTAQLDASSSHLNPGLSDVVELMKSSIGDLQATLKHRNQHVRFKKPRKGIMLSLDITETKLAFINLIENASKYSHEGSLIEVAIKDKKSFVEISVKDDGVGIAKKYHEKVFEKFTRVDNELSDMVAGSGLGLYWVKQIAEMHGGSIELISAHAQGSTFTMKLPKPADD